MAQVLGRVTGVQLDSPRGADVVHGVRVPRSWLETGETIRVKLPRSLSCARCGGGGCDDCGRAGALSLWPRDEPPAELELHLPRRTAAELDAAPTLVLRIPEAGGRPPVESGHGRGHLLLRVSASTEADANVRRIERAPSAPASATTAAGPVSPRRWLPLLALALLALISFILSRP